MKPKLLDLFCGAGGASMGYHRAGFEVVGVDFSPQKNYPFEFIQGDAMSWLTDMPDVHFDAIHASPPCQGYSRTARLHPGIEYPLLIEPTRILLEKSGLPWVIENTPPAPIRPDYDLCGTVFGLKTRRHRWFEVSWGPVAHLHHPCVDHKESPVQVFGHGGDSSHYWTMDEWNEAMGIDWMNRAELAESIPPAYTEYIGLQLMQYLEHGKENVQGAEL